VCQVEYPAGQVSPPALVSALTRAGVGADTLNSVAGKLLAAQYLQGGVPLDTLISSSLLRDRDMNGGAVRPTIIVAVKQALGVRLPPQRAFVVQCSDWRAPCGLPTRAFLNIPPRGGPRHSRCASAAAAAVLVAALSHTPVRFVLLAARPLACVDLHYALLAMMCVKEEAQRQRVADAEAARKQAEVRDGWRPKPPSCASRNWSELSFFLSCMRCCAP
jgi:hypothetical protein